MDPLSVLANVATSNRDKSCVASGEMTEEAEVTVECDPRVDDALLRNDDEHECLSFLDDDHSKAEISIKNSQGDERLLQEKDMDLEEEAQTWRPRAKSGSRKKGGKKKRVRTQTTNEENTSLEAGNNPPLPDELFGEKVAVSIPEELFDIDLNRHTQRDYLP